MDAKWWPECLRHIRQWQKFGFGRLSATVKVTAPQRHEPLGILDSLPQASSREAWHRGCDVRKNVRQGSDRAGIGSACPSNGANPDRLVKAAMPAAVAASNTFRWDRSPNILSSIQGRIRPQVGNIDQEASREIGVTRTAGPQGRRE